MKTMRRRFYLLTALLLFTGGMALAQQYDPAGMSKKAKAFYQQAQRYLGQGDPYGDAGAMEMLKKAIHEDSSFLDAYAQLGSLYARDRRYREAVPYFEKAYQIDADYFREGLLMYAKSAAGTGDFAKALQLTREYLQAGHPGSGEQKRAKQLEADFNFALQFLQKKIPFSPVNLGDSINSADPEYFPSLTIDQQTFVFTRNLHNRNEDFFFSHLNADSSWSQAINAGAPLNTRYNEGAQTISQDGKLLLSAICNSPDGYGSCDIFYAVKTANGWSRPQNIGSQINTGYWETQPCLSPDKQDLYFVSNRPGGLGGSDIYVSHLQQNGTWGKPENLGPDINTAGEESSPFIHADNQTLFFASNGWPGIGDMDLFYARKKPDGSWNKPENLGYPINTIDHEGSLFVAADGKTAYFASDRSDSRGQLDIYRFELYPEARAIRTLYVKGYVYDAKTKERLSAILHLADLDSGRTVTLIRTDSQGNYLVTLPVGRNYAFNVSRKGYLFHSENFSLKDQLSEKPFLINIGLQPIEVNEGVILKNIFFDFNQYTLKPASKTELENLVKLMQENPELKIRINGHTDDVGGEKDNLILSQKRAQAVVNYLVSKGISSDRLVAKGYGESKPVAQNDTDEGRAQNRRTEFVVTGK